MVDKQVWIYQFVGKLSAEERRKIITCSMFLKEKFDANGVFEKLKSRLVAHGNQQPKENVKASSPTVDIASVFVLAAVAAYENNRVSTIDIGGAFLEAKMTGENVYLRLDKLMVQLLEEIDPTSIPYVDDKGELVAKLDKALYGCLQASLLWYNRLSDVLVAYNLTGSRRMMSTSVFFLREKVMGDALYVFMWMTYWLSMPLTV